MICVDMISMQHLFQYVFLNLKRWLGWSNLRINRRGGNQGLPLVKSQGGNIFRKKRVNAKVPLSKFISVRKESENQASEKLIFHRFCMRQSILLLLSVYDISIADYNQFLLQLPVYFLNASHSGIKM